MATSRGVGIIFRQFLRQTKNNRINTTIIPTACYSTDKDEITTNPFFETYAGKIKRAQGSERCVYALLHSALVVVELYLSTLTPSTVADFHGGRENKHCHH
jgi:hypothetical protein